MDMPPALDPAALAALAEACGRDADLDAVQHLLWAQWRGEEGAPTVPEPPPAQARPPAAGTSAAPPPAELLDLLAALPLPCWLLEAESIIHANPAALQYLGAEVRDILGQPLPRWLCLRPEADGTNAQLWMDVAGPERDGHPRPARCTWIPLGQGREAVVLQDLHPLQEIRSSLETTTDLLQGVVESSLNGIMAFESIRDEAGAITDFRFTLVNDAALEMVPFDRETLMGGTLLKLMPGNKTTGLFDAYCAVVETGAPFESEHHYAHEEEGIHAWFRTVAVRTGDGFSVTFSDVTSHRENLSRIEAQNHLLDLFVAHSPAAIAMFDTEMRYVLASKRWYEDYGLSGEEILGRSHYEIFPEIDARWRDIHAACQAGETAHCEADPFLRGDGREDWVRWEIHPWYLSPGVQGGIIIFTEVITERRRFQEEMKRSEDRLRAFINAVPAGLIAVDSEGITQYANQAARELLNLPTLGQGGMPLPFQGSLRRGGDAPYPIHELPLIRALRGEATTLQDLDIPHPLGRVPLEVTARPIRGEGERIDYAVAVFSDITERLRVDRLKSEFISTVSHELRTPLTAIQGSLGLILGGALGVVPPPLEEMLTIAHRNSERLVLLINDILDTEKIASGKSDFHPEHLDLGAQAALAIASVRALATARGIALVLDAPAPNLGSAPTVSADPARLQQVFVNLLSNALKFSGEGTSVVVEVLLHGDHVEVGVLDRGPGISDAFRPRIFQKFSQEDSSDTRQRGGTGLGLFICKAILERSGGTIGYHNRAGGGARFFFRLPRVDPGAPSLEEEGEDVGAAVGEQGSARRAKKADAPGEASLQGQERARILYVEDDPSLQATLAGHLKGLGELVFAPTLSLARRLLHTQPFDLIILDQRLPDGDGLDLVPLIQSLIGPDTPTIVFSAFELSLKHQPHITAALVKSRATTDSLTQLIVRLLDLKQTPGTA